MMDDMNMNMNTSSMDDTMLMDDMDDNMNGMTMTFGSWKAYKIKVLVSFHSVDSSLLTGKEFDLLYRSLY